MADVWRPVNGITIKEASKRLFCSSLPCSGHAGGAQE